MLHAMWGDSMKDKEVTIKFMMPEDDLIGENSGLEDITQTIQNYCTSDVTITVNGKKVETP